MSKALLKKLIPDSLWTSLRTRKIVRQHAKVAKICEQLIENAYATGLLNQPLMIRPLKTFQTQKIIWQYWAQGYDNLPPIVSDCLKSIDQWKGDYKIIRLEDSNLSEYIELPVWIKAKRTYMSRAYFSDLLRLCLLATYGGVWLDATVFMSGPIPKRYEQLPFFLYQRDVNEDNKDYWKNTYAYYFGWAQGFRVNMLSSIIFAKKESQVIRALCQVSLNYWKTATAIPDYFFLQILFDVLMKGRMVKDNCPIEDDCLPHYLQQYRNDPKFSLANEETILKMIPFHKLTYK